MQIAYVWRMARVLREFEGWGGIGWRVNRTVVRPLAVREQFPRLLRKRRKARKPGRWDETTAC